MFDLARLPLPALANELRGYALQSLAAVNALVAQRMPLASTSDTELAR